MQFIDQQYSPLDYTVLDAPVSSSRFAQDCEITPYYTDLNGLTWFSFQLQGPAALFCQETISNDVLVLVSTGVRLALKLSSHSDFAGWSNVRSVSGRAQSVEVDYMGKKLCL